jgi:glutamate dehydrogenase
MLRAVGNRRLPNTLGAYRLHGLTSNQALFSSKAKKDESNSKVASWVPQRGTVLEDATRKAMIHEISMAQMNSTAEIVPWFLDQMPNSYFRHVGSTARAEHMKVIAAIMDLKQDNLAIKMHNTVSKERRDVTFISTGAAGTNRLTEELTHLEPTDVAEGFELSKLAIFSSLDERLNLNIYSYTNGEKVVENENFITDERLAEARDTIRQYATSLSTSTGKDEYGRHLPDFDEDLFGEAALDEYMARCTSSYIINSNPRRFLLQRELFEKVKFASPGADGTSVTAEQYHGREVPHLDGKNASWFTIASGNANPQSMLGKVSGILASRGLSIYRVHMDKVRDDPCREASVENNFVSMLRVLVTPSAGGADIDVGPDSPITQELLQMLKRIKWLDQETVDLALKYPQLGLENAEIISALASLSVGNLSKQGLSQASQSYIISALTDNPIYFDLAVQVSKLFQSKFKPDPDGKPSMSKGDYFDRLAKLKTRISSVQAESERMILHAMLEATDLTLRTNFYVPDRFALSMRLNPKLMMDVASADGSNKDKPLPYGVFFVHGSSFSAFHCRFRDISRGGLRIVTPGTKEQHVVECTRHFDEVYGLSLGQQLKNKDIPEGGSKAVIICNTADNDPGTKDAVMRYSVRAFTDSLLDLIVDGTVQSKHLVDYLRKDELIYLGPDEQCLPQDIDYICHRAGVRGYPIPAAFMSSKPGAGINHKVYGVTSEGVAVFLMTALKDRLGIDPTTDPFSVKITGGPDGDVGGNLLRILIESCPKVQIMGVADGSGVAEDTEGLDHGELLRLFEEAKPIAEFNAAKLSSQGSGALVMDISTEEGVMRRNSMHFRIKTDAFIPAGGRPNTINSSNCHEFIDANGEPASPLIVEGANIFITADARTKLFEMGKVAIVKDSSANKCGVITPSCALAASMLLSEQAFRDAKEESVADVREKIKKHARDEAELLFREYSNYPGQLVSFSEQISAAINMLTDAINDMLQTVEPNDALFQELYPLIEENLPAKLVELAGDRIPERMPVQYQRATIASTLASKMVYREGIHFVQAQRHLGSTELGMRAVEYYRKSHEMDEFIATLTTSIDSKQKIDPKLRARAIDLLKKGATRAALNIY